MSPADRLLETLESLLGSSIGVSLPFIHKTPGPKKVAWFNRSSGQLYEMYAIRVEQESDDVRVFLNIIDTTIGKLYAYKKVVSFDEFTNMASQARSHGITSIEFPHQWVVVKP